MRQMLIGFIAGVLAVPLFHQGMLVLFRVVGWSKRPVYQMTPTEPLGVPAIFSMSFWGGVWGILLALVLSRFSGWSYWVIALLFGAFALSVVAWFVVMPLKGMGIAGGGGRPLIVGTLLVNGAWGVGAALLIKLFEQLRR